MGDMSEPKGQSLDERTNEPIMYQIHKTLGRAAKQKQKYMQNSTIKKKSKLNDDRIGSRINSLHKPYHVAHPYFLTLPKWNILISWDNLLEHFRH